MKYKIVTGILKVVEKEVNYYLKEGYELSGNLVATGKEIIVSTPTSYNDKYEQEFAQAMTLTESKDSLDPR